MNLNCVIDVDYGNPLVFSFACFTLLRVSLLRQLPQQLRTFDFLFESIVAQHIQGKCQTLFYNCSNFCRIFRLRGVRQMFGGPIFEGRNEILLLGKALKFMVIFQKYAFKCKNWKIMEKIREKCNFSRCFIFSGTGKNNEYNIEAIIGCSGTRKLFKKFMNRFHKFHEFLREFE